MTLNTEKGVEQGGKLGQTFSEVDMGCLVHRPVGVFKVADQSAHRLLARSDQVDGLHRGQRLTVLVDVLDH